MIEICGVTMLDPESNETLNQKVGHTHPIPSSIPPLQETYTPSAHLPQEIIVPPRYHAHRDRRVGVHRPSTNEARNIVEQMFHHALGEQCRVACEVDTRHCHCLWKRLYLGLNLQQRLDGESEDGGDVLLHVDVGGRERREFVLYERAYGPLKCPSEAEDGGGFLIGEPVMIRRELHWV